MAPVERVRFLHTTSYDALAEFVNGLRHVRGIGVTEMAKSREGRSLWLVHVGASLAADRTGSLRVLLFAQQHGDEPSGKEALTLLLSKCVDNAYRDSYPGIELLIVPQMNPDGAERDQRRTSDTLDLNRSHVLLHSPETRALHEVFDAWRPQVTLDLHEFGSMSRDWIEAGFTKITDVQFGMLTNLNSSPAIRQYEHEFVFPSLKESMTRHGYSFSEYLVGSPADRLRHSTTEINDGRQSFGILNAMSFIQEGRNRRNSGEDLERRARSQLTAIEALLSFCSAHAAEIRQLVDREQTKLSHPSGEQFVLRMEHASGGGSMEIPVRMVATKKDTTWTVRPYHDLVRPLVTTTIPSAYVVPKECTSIIALLDRHRISSEVLGTDRQQRVESYAVTALGSDTLEEDPIARPVVKKSDGIVTLHAGDVVVPTSQWKSRLIVTMLEPESMWGLTKYEPFEWMLHRPVFPILRIP